MIVVYGATGFTGRLVATHLAEAGIDIVIAGRREGPVAELASSLGVDHRVGSLTDLDLGGTTALVNCAGPFSVTAPPLLERCLSEGVHYLDLAGEVDEHLAAGARDTEAREVGILVLPGAGFGIVATDCLAAHVAARVPGVNRLDLAVRTVGGVSRGTAEVVLGGLRTPGVVRRGGRLVRRSAGHARRRIDFGDGDGPVTVVTNPWRADVATSVLQVPDVEGFMAFPIAARALMRIPHGGLLASLSRHLPEGPSAKAMARGRTAVWASASNGVGGEATAVLHGPEAYLFTAGAVLTCVQHVVSGDAPPGRWTPATAWGADLALDIPGTRREDRATPRRTPP